MMGRIAERCVGLQIARYLVATTDGCLLNGLIIAKSTDSVTLRKSQGIAPGVTVERIAEVLEFLKER
ncbi:MAG: hypothetical protein U0936_06560 [Planctomycetaceae bacterium]